MSRVAELEAEIAAEKEARRVEIRKSRAKDRVLTVPGHYHATVWCFVEQDANQNMKDAQHNEVLGRSIDACIRKALNRSEDRQREYHVSMVTECYDRTHQVGLEN